MFANDGLTRAFIGDDNASGRPMSFTPGDVLRLVDRSDNSKTYDFSAAGTEPITFSGQLPKGANFKDYTAYLISAADNASKWSSTGVPSISGVGEKKSSLDAAFKYEAVIYGNFVDTSSDGIEDEYVLSLKNAFVMNTTEDDVTFWYTGSAESVTLKKNEAVAVAAGTMLRNQASTEGAKTRTVEANYIYKF